MKIHIKFIFQHNLWDHLFCVIKERLINMTLKVSQPINSSHVKYIDKQGHLFYRYWRKSAIFPF